MHAFTSRREEAPVEHPESAALRARPLPCRVPAPALVGAVLLAVDLAAFGAAAWTVQLARAVLWDPVSHPPTLWSSALLWVGLRLFEQLYPGYGLAGPEELRRATWTTVVAGLGHAAVLFATQEAAASRFLAMGTWGLLVVVNWPIRSCAKGLLVRLDLFNCPIVVAGAGRTGALAVLELRKDRQLGFVPVAVFDDDPRKHGQALHGVPVVGPLRSALDVDYGYPVHHAVIAMPGAPGRFLVDLARQYAGRYPNLGVIPDLFGMANLWVSPRCLGTILTLEVHNNLLHGRNRLAKRALDLAVGGPLALVTLPIVALAGLVVKLVSPGPALFRQEREGQGGETIPLLKLRTMVPDAEQRLADYLERDHEARLEWERRMKLVHDPRVVPVVGALLRRFSADELPQFWNVLRGEMSLVGPRPFPRYHLERFPSQFRQLRRQVPAGLTGLWQVNDRSDGDLEVQQAADAYYIHNWSLWLDLWVLFRTVRVVFLGKGAY